MDFCVRVSARARRVRLVVSAGRGLEIVVPEGFDRSLISKIVEQKRPWIERNLARMGARRRRLEREPQLPNYVVLLATGEEWAVQYRRAPSKGRSPNRVTLHERPGRLLVVTGDVESTTACREALRRWLHRKARDVLIPRLSGIARQHGFHYERVVVRQQRTRWASCSKKGTISINARLLFLPSPVVDYVLLHELCHTVELNHSARFWALVEAHDPSYLHYKKELRRAGASLPAWLDHEIEKPGI